MSRPLLLAFALSVGVPCLAENHPAAPQLSSNSGATYTLYLDFSGFNYPGKWAGGTPGNVPAYDTDGNTSSFSTAEAQEIREVWAGVCQKYVGFNVNVTTVDPATAGLTDSQRKAYYDTHAHMMHTIIGGSNSWYNAGAGGVSYVGTTQYAYGAGTEYHTNWIFPDNLGSGYPKYVAEASAHENGHGLSLPHQHDETSGAEYSTNNYAQGNGSYAPVLGVGYYSQRSTWRVGDPRKGNVNDISVLLSNDQMGGFIDDGVGHSIASATNLVLKGNTIDSSEAKGWIMPASTSNPNPLGESNYTRDYFSFTTGSGVVSITATDGTTYLHDGVADPGATLESVLRIYNKQGLLVGTGTMDATTLKETFSGYLNAGEYYAQVASYGGYTSSYEPNAHYYTMGGYFLSGELAPVPEPMLFAAMGLGLLAVIRRRRAR